MHLLIIIVVGIVLAGLLLQQPSILGRFLFWFSVPFIVLIVIALVGSVPHG